MVVGCARGVVVGCAGGVAVGCAGGVVVGCAGDTTTTCLLLWYTGVHLYTGLLRIVLCYCCTSSLNLVVSVEAILDVQVMAQRTCVRVCIVFMIHHTTHSSLPLVKVLAHTVVPHVCPGSLGWEGGWGLLVWLL